MNKSNSQEYSTSDLGLAAFLICCETKLSGIDRTNPRRVAFIIGNCKPESISAWQSGRGLINALAYYSALQTLKGKIWREC